MSDLFGEDYEGRKAVPVFEGCVMYFPKSMAAVAAVSEAGNKQHNPGEPLHWARSKSMDQYNTALRHMMDHRMGGGRMDPQQEGQTINNGWKTERYDKDGVRHLAKAAWRIMAALELDMEEEQREQQEKQPGKLSQEPPLEGVYTVDPSRVDVFGCYCYGPNCPGHKFNTGTCRK